MDVAREGGSYSSLYFWFGALYRLVIQDTDMFADSKASAEQKNSRKVLTEAMVIQ